MTTLFKTTTALALLLFGLSACETATSPAQSAQDVDTHYLAPKQASFSMPSKVLNPSKTMSRIGFGSCLKEISDMSIWNDITNDKPDVFVLLGDNVYGDEYPDRPDFNNPDMPKMQASYSKLADSLSFAKFRVQTPLLVTWDDHDYGLNDGGADYPFRDRSKELFLTAWNIPKTDPRHHHDGVYSSEMLGPNGQRIQIILLDTRYFRGPLQATDERGAEGKERYVPATDSQATMLGEEQWNWLAEELQKPADLRFIISSIQVIADGHGWEAWRTLPHERDKLYQTIDNSGSQNIILISGDRHAGALYARNDVTNMPLYEMTTSSLNAPVSAWKSADDTYVEPGPYRLTAMQDNVNYGMADIDWEKQIVTLRLVSPDHDTFKQSLSFKDAIIRPLEP